MGKMISFKNSVEFTRTVQLEDILNIDSIPPNAYKCIH